MKDEEVRQLEKALEEAEKKAEVFLSLHKGKWFTVKEVAEELKLNRFIVSDALFDLRWRPLNLLLRRYKKKTIGLTSIHKRVW